MRTLPTAFLVIILAACVQTETTAQMRTRSQIAASTQSRAQDPSATTDATIVVEFDLPDGFESAPAGSPNAVTGFRVGYFKANEATATHTRDVGRDAVVVATYLVTGGSGAGGPREPAQRANGPVRSGSQYDVTNATESIVLEFDLPAEFEKRAGSEPSVTGFRVGYFRASDPKAIRTLDFGTDALDIQGRTARARLPRESGCGLDCRIRVQTLSAGQVSAWSDPVPLEISASPSARPKPQATEPARPARPERPRAASPGQRRSGLALSDIEPYQELSKALRALLTSDQGIETEVRRFRRIQDLALAVAISREYSIPLGTLSRAIEGPPRLTPRNALAKLRPDLGAPAVRKVRPHARALLAKPADPSAAR